MQKNGAETSSLESKHTHKNSHTLGTGDDASTAAFEIDLVATILSVSRGEPQILVAIDEADGRMRWRLPTVRFGGDNNDCLSKAVRDGIYEQTGIRLGYVDQLSTDLVSDHPSDHNGASHLGAKRLNISYVALSGEKSNPHGLIRGRHTWLPLYAILPWEDFRSGRPLIIRNVIEPHLDKWAGSMAETEDSRRNNVRVCFGTCQGGWDEEKVSERLSLLLGAEGLQDLLREHQHVRRAARDDTAVRPADYDERHLHYVANALAHMRTRIKVKPLVFEMVADRFTLYELQQTVEAILGPPLHKQNFRRLVEHMGLVEPTGEIKSHTGGRPAQLFRFRPSVVLEQVHPGMRVRGARL